MTNREIARKLIDYLHEAGDWDLHPPDITFYKGDQELSVGFGVDYQEDLYDNNNNNTEERFSLSDLSDEDVDKSIELCGLKAYAWFKLIIDEVYKHHNQIQNILAERKYGR